MLKQGPQWEGVQVWEWEQLRLQLRDLSQEPLATGKLEPKWGWAMGLQRELELELELELEWMVVRELEQM